MVQKLELHEIPYEYSSAIRLLECNNIVESMLDVFFDKIDGIFYLNLTAANDSNWEIRELKQQ